MRNMNVSKQMTEFLKGHAESVLTVEEICSGTGLRDTQVRYAMRRLMEETPLGKYIAILVRGNSWEIGAIPGGTKPEPKEAQGPATPTTALERVGTLQDGAAVFRDQKGNLFRVEAL